MNCTTYKADKNKINYKNKQKVLFSSQIPNELLQNWPFLEASSLNYKFPKGQKLYLTHLGIPNTKNNS